MSTAVAQIPTDKEARKLYTVAACSGEPPPHGASEWPPIYDEMRAVVAANGPRLAGKIIEWWGCWRPGDTATAGARRIREMWEMMQ